jgi:uncharacterized ferritin-like protein (DUF455 family)
VETVASYARSILLQPSLAAKLRAPPSDLVDGAADPILVEAPARDGMLAMRHGSDKLPRPGALADAGARAACLSRFAHHELQAIELFAWALLAFPQLPAALRRGMVQALGEEQQHCALYIARLAAHDVEFGALALSGYFWKHVPAIAAAPNPALAFLCAQGLTLEQANLDFTIIFRDGFAAAGDHESARVCQRVHDDEIGHVKLAASWTKRISSMDDLAAYQAHALFPFSLARAKGRRFEEKARTKAGLSRELIEAVRAARPYAE